MIFNLPNECANLLTHILRDRDKGSSHFRHQLDGEGSQANPLAHDSAPHRRRNGEERYGFGLMGGGRQGKEGGGL